MKVVIGGGSGLIGSALATALLEAGHEPVILSRRAPAGSSAAPAGAAGTAIRHVAWDPLVPGDWARELSGAGAVINLAGASIGHWPWTKGRKAELIGSRVTATRALVDAIRGLPEAERPKVFLSASGTDLYEGRDATPAEETAEPADTFLSQLVLAWEAEASKAAQLGLRVVLVRTSPVVARGAASLRIEALPFRLFVGGRLGSGRQWWSWIDGSDIVGIYLWALATESVTGPINATAPDPRQQADFAKALGVVLHRPSWFPAPGFMIRLLLGDQATLAIGSRRVWPAAALAGGYAFKRPRLEDSLANALGPQPART
jgi:uncharacterized protein (TIGR01777 family)